MFLDRPSVGQEQGRGSAQRAVLALMRDLFELQIMKIDPIAVGDDDLSVRCAVLPAETAGALQIKGSARLHHPCALGIEGELLEVRTQAAESGQIVVDPLCALVGVCGRIPDRRISGNNKASTTTRKRDD